MQATKNVLDVAREKGASHFVLLSAICVQKPLLEFQRAKLKLEADLQVGPLLEKSTHYSGLEALIAAVADPVGVGTGVSDDGAAGLCGSACFAGHVHFPLQLHPCCCLSCLQAAGDITYSIVRPTAFFKSLAGQIELVKQGKPYVMFGDGNLASCKPISEQDLAKFMADCITGMGSRYGAVDVLDLRAICVVRQAPC